MMKQFHLSSFGRLTDSAWLILLGLQDHPMDGRELLTFLEEGKRWLEPGTLWATLSRLERAGLISQLVSDRLCEPPRRYDITDAGLSVLTQERDISLQAEGRIGLRFSRGVVHGWLMVLIKWIVRLYPKAWRERYEQEMLDLLSEHEITLRTWLDLLWNALDARLDSFYRRLAPLSPFRRERRVQWVMLAAFFLPVLSAVFWMNFFWLGTGPHPDYWTRNQHYPILALTHQLGSIGVTVAILCALLALIVLASGGIKKFGRPGDAIFHRLILVAMCLPLGLMFAMSLLSSFFPDLLRGNLGNTVIGGGILLISLLLTGWGVLRPEAFKRALLYLLPWLGFHLFVLTTMLGVLYPPSENTILFYQPIGLLCLLSTPLSFAVALVRLRLGKQLRFILLMIAAVGTLSMTLVQLMMVARLIITQYLGLGMIWTPELIFLLSVNVFATVLALVLLLSLLLKRRKKAQVSTAASS